MKPRIIGIILARTDSSRLPRKVLQNIQGIPLIGYVIERAKAIQGLDCVVLATTDRTIDDSLAAYAHKQNISVYRGHTHDVAYRVLQCAKTYQSDYFVRINGDSPFLDPELIHQGIEHCQQQVEIVTNLIERTYPYGISVEIIRTKSYERTYNQLDNQEDREHVTLYLYRNIEQFTVHSMVLIPPYTGKAHLVVDTLEDMKRFKQVVGYLGKDICTIGFQEVVDVYHKL
jgi:spore coat polysaccharide biosynthesis protein SpsF